MPFSDENPPRNADRVWELEELIQDFEARWFARADPSIADFVPESAADRSAVLVELAHVELELRLKDGERVDPSSYVRRFPELDTPEILRSLRETAARFARVDVIGPGDMLGRYRIQSEVGHGGFGVVYRAVDTRNGDIVAVKVGKSLDHNNRGRFEREKRIGAMLRHRSIARQRDFGSVSGLPYIVTDFIEGETLERRLKRGTMKPKEAAALAADIAGGLAYAHSRDVIHRDVKPANIMIDETGRPVLLDFGLARRYSEEDVLTTSQGLLGTCLYMSPEQASADGGKLDGRSDLYSLGVVLYECLTGRRPFKGCPEGVIDQIKYDMPRPPRRIVRSIPHALEIICLKCLEKNPADRYQNGTELVEDLKQFLQDKSINSRSPSQLAKLRRWCGRHPRQFAARAALAGAVGLAVLGMGLAAVHQMRADRAENNLRVQQPRPRPQAPTPPFEILRPSDEIKPRTSAPAGPIADRGKSKIQPRSSAVLPAFLSAWFKWTEPSPMERADEQIRLGMQRRLEGDRERAFKHFLMADERLDEARASGVALEKIASKRISVANQLGRYWSEVGDRARADEYYRRASALAIDHGSFGERAEALNRRGLLLRDAGDLAEARRLHLRAASPPSPVDEPLIREQVASAHLALGILAAKVGDDFGALAVYKSVAEYVEPLLEHSPNRAELLMTLGKSRANSALVCVKLGLFERALTLYRDAIASLDQAREIHPDSPELLHEWSVFADGIARLLHTAGRREEVRKYYDGAIQVQRRILSLEPRDSRSRKELARTLFAKGLLLIRLKDYGGAEACFRECRDEWDRHGPIDLAGTDALEQRLECDQELVILLINAGGPNQEILMLFQEILTILDRFPLDLIGERRILRKKAESWIRHLRGR